MGISFPFWSRRVHARPPATASRRHAPPRAARGARCLWRAAPQLPGARANARGADGEHRQTDKGHTNPKKKRPPATLPKETRRTDHFSHHFGRSVGGRGAETEQPPLQKKKNGRARARRRAAKPPSKRKRARRGTVVNAPVGAGRGPRRAWRRGRGLPPPRGRGRRGWGGRAEAAARGALDPLATDAPSVTLPLTLKIMAHASNACNFKCRCAPGRAYSEGAPLRRRNQPRCSVLSCPSCELTGPSRARTPYAACSRRQHTAQRAPADNSCRRPSPAPPHSYLLPRKAACPPMLPWDHG